MKDRFKDLVKPYLKEAKKELIEFLSINSIYDEESSEESAPFGRGVEEALNYIAKLGEKFGFNVDRCDNYCTELSYGEGQLVDVYAHVDVVPVSKNWKTDPFKPEIIDGNVYARGATDDKGPGLATLFAAKALLDNDMIKGYKLRLIFGGNEERGSLCLHHYFNEMKKEYPSYGFSPDADFPMIYAEKSIYGFKVVIRNKSLKPLPVFSCGEAGNIVIGECEFKLPENLDGIEEVINDYRKEHPEVTITYRNRMVHVFGKPVHGSTPWLGVNAGLHALNILGKLGWETSHIFDALNSGKGEQFGGDYVSSVFDCSSYCVGFVKSDGEKLFIDINARVPEDVEAKDIAHKLTTALSGPVEIKSMSKGFVMDPKSELVKTLLKVYQEETGDMTSRPMAIGGGTYARESKNTIAFGPTFIGRDYRIHQDDEFISVEDYEALISIYAHTIFALGELCKE